MPWRMFFQLPLAAAFGTLLIGCGSPVGGNVSLAPAEGTVKLNGAPLAGASVVFIPEDGPIATGTTDLSGKFKLITAGQPGVAVGQCKVTVSAMENADVNDAAGKAPKAPGSQAEGKAFIDQMMSAQKKAIESGGKPADGSPGAKSIIPSKYAQADTSGLKFTVTKDSAKNQFTIELTSS